MACPYISVLTVSTGRRELLLRKAEALAVQSLPPERFEWVVCLNGGDDGTASALQALGLPFSLRVFDTDRVVSAGVARNACAQRTCGSVLLFSDDDCLPGAGDLAAHVAEQERGLCAAVGAIHFQGADGSVNAWRPDRVGFWNLNGANSSVPGVAFRAVGGFDEGLSGYGGEDVELGYRLAAYGLPFRALPSAVARHLGPDPRAAGDRAKARSAGLNAARVGRRHPQVRWRLGVHPLQLGLKRLLFPLGLASWLERLGGASAAYERAYLEGALSLPPRPSEETA